MNKVFGHRGVREYQTVELAAKAGKVLKANYVVLLSPRVAPFSFLFLENSLYSQGRGAIDIKAGNSAIPRSSLFPLLFLRRSDERR